MESQFRPGFETEAGRLAAGGFQGPPPAPAMSTNTHTATPLPGYIFRLIAVVLTFISATVMGAAREKVIATVQDEVTGSITQVSLMFRSTYSAAYVYFVVVNAIVFFYSLASLLISLSRRNGNYGGVGALLAIPDLIMTILLFSGNGAAAAISLVAEKGQLDFAGWEKICDVVDNFCARVNAAIVLSMLSAVSYMLLVLLSILALNKKSF